jgi:hypothetical protein
MPVTAIANRTSATMAIVSREDNFMPWPCLDRIPPERPGKMAPCGETAARPGGAAGRHRQRASGRPRGKAARPRPSPAKAPRNRALSWRLGKNCHARSSRDRIARSMVARFAAETSSKGLKPLHARENLPSRIATICPCIGSKFSPNSARARRELHGRARPL